MQDKIERLNKRYGQDWFRYQPPGSMPITISEVTDIITRDPGYPFAHLKQLICQHGVEINEFLVVNYYSLKLAIVKDNPNWFGLDYREGTPYDLMGRVWWQPVVQNIKPHIIRSITPNVVYQNNPPAQITPTTEGFCLLQAYYTPRILVQPGEGIAIEILFGDNNAGIDPPPEDFTWMLVGEVRGYQLLDPTEVDR